MGVPYVWGGTSPSGFDCSGFTQYVFRQCGYSINRTAAAQYSNGSYVSYDSLQAGDLVFFANTYAASGITHVGIYIGGGQFIHCANGGVKISSLSESYYSSRYYGARRIA
jgi:cell wall-associated NlpC family hydrolase